MTSQIISNVTFNWGVTRALLPGVLVRGTNVCVCYMEIYNTKVRY